MPACRIARFYGIDPRGMGRGERHAWEFNMHKVTAEEVLRERGGSLSPDDLYKALVITTGDKRAADLARSRRELEVMRARGERG